MKKLDRRSFLTGAAKSAGAALALGMLPPSIARALSVQAAVDTGTIKDIKHIVILMLENRGFDHYFGTLKGVRGYGDRLPIPLESGKDVWYQQDASGNEIPPYHMDMTKVKALQSPSTPHSFSDMQAAWNQGKSGHWPVYKTPYTMGYLARNDIPFHFALAEAFTICDNHFCSTTSGTDPNRVVFFSGSGFDPKLAKMGINSDDRTSEPNNDRCWITGTMPTPGYTYADNALTWLSLPSVLENAGVSWKIYQDTNDNWTGAMHGGLAFQDFRTAKPGDPLYVKGMTDYSIADLKNDVMGNTLPEVSWILCTAANSEHSGNSNPAIGANFTAEVLDAVTANPEVWAQTAFFLTYDENDGLFDHVPPPAPPSYNLDGTLAGKATLPLDGEYFSDPARKYLNAKDTISGNVRPWGLSARVPMYVISPWSKGGWVNSQVFDHTSMSLFLEKRFDITVDAVSPWHRAVCGDLTSCFDFVSPNDPVVPTLPDTSNYQAVLAAQASLPIAAPPATPQPLFQEPGTRFSRALPYELHTSARIEGPGLVKLMFSNTGKQGAVFHVYDKSHMDRIPRRYTVEAGKALEDYWDDTLKTDLGKYELWVYGPNGFLRTFAGNAVAASTATFMPEVQVCYDTDAGQVYVKLHNTGTAPGTVTVQSNAYRTDGPWQMNVPAGDVGMLHWDLSGSGNWYDFTVTGDNFMRRFSGRIETGKPTVSDPAMALHLS
ncbi:phospholipase C, phosphocholine-specific [Paraburkholderia sp. FT54]|uniref:phosphocholine-specific phospholipase C n=1 Tax=Paraburkholderia sp. FT54 TaxID=3074437 RepID=UPI002877EB3A|nr:phospholipase C, phosphocholine-specific [Paraburkholderia sp. FT54]WNC88389.1 phospholipase C, phosphocholine-specific [Paraburkholderia sp. FT54]